MPKYEVVKREAVELVETKEWFIRANLPGTPAIHDTLKYIKSKGYILEEKRSSDKNGKLFKWTGEMKPRGTRTNAAIKAGKLIEKPEYCPFTNYSFKHAKGNVDHRNGRVVMEENDIDPETITAENADNHFIWISRDANAIKREACKKCVNTGIKTPGRIAGIAIEQGGYDGSCKGCYWSDPVEFTFRNLERT